MENEITGIFCSRDVWECSLTALSLYAIWVIFYEEEKGDEEGERWK